MKKIFIEPINYLMILDKYVKRVILEDSKLYQMISLELEKNVVYSINDKVEILEKKALLLYNPFQINLNETKLLKSLYKKLENEIRVKFSQKLNIIENSLLNFFDDLTMDEVIPVEYNEDVDIQKLFSSFGMCYKSSDNYLERLVNYIKVYNEVFGNTIIISFGLLNLLNKEEVLLLEKELQYLNINLIDISFVNKNIEKDLIIDDDWCII